MLRHPYGTVITVAGNTRFVSSLAHRRACFRWKLTWLLQRLPSLRAHRKRYLDQTTFRHVERTISQTSTALEPDNGNDVDIVPTEPLKSSEQSYVYSHAVAGPLRATVWGHWLGVQSKKEQRGPKSPFAELRSMNIPAAPEIIRNVARIAAQHPFLAKQGAREALTDTLLALTLVPGMPAYRTAFSNIAAVLIAYMPHEDAFWSMVAIVSSLLPHDEVVLLVDLRIFSEILSEKFNELVQTLQARQIDFCTFATDWIESAFCAHFTVGNASRLLDVMFAEGNSTLLVRVLHAFVQINHKKLLTMVNNSALEQFANDWARKGLNIEQVVGVCAKDGLTAFIQKRRQELREVSTPTSS